MKTILSLSIATLFIVQSTAMAQPARTAGIAQGAIEVAKADIKELKSGLLKLDDSLAQIELELQKNEKFNADRFWTLAGATAGVALSTAGYLLLLTQKDTLNGYTFLAGTIVTGLLSCVGNLSEGAAHMLPLPQYSDESRSKALNKVIQEITFMEEKALEDAVKQDEIEIKQNLIDLSVQSRATRQALEEYNTRQDITSALKMAAGLSQFVGAVGIATTALSGKSSFFRIGALLATTGHLARVAAHLTEGETEVLLKSIRETRSVIQTAQGELN